MPARPVIDMEFSFTFFLNSVLLGAALAVDAFSVSAADGMAEPDMKKTRRLAIAGTFGGFQLCMTFAGWFIVSTVSHIFAAVQKFIPWISLILLLFLGIRMIAEGIKSAMTGRGTDGTGGPAGGPADPAGASAPKKVTGAWALAVQGIATSIDALSVGFTVSGLSFTAAAVESSIIGIVTFAICIGGVFVGKKFGDILAEKAEIAGGAVLVAIGIEIFVKALLDAGSPVWLIK